MNFRFSFAFVEGFEDGKRGRWKDELLVLSENVIYALEGHYRIRENYLSSFGNGVSEASTVCTEIQRE